MGNTATREGLLARWTELVNDPSLQDLPYKIELNEGGKIEMSPATNRHGILQGALVQTLSKARPDGIALVECSVLTAIGVRVADVAWISKPRAAKQSDDGPYLEAPEICIEVVSPANSGTEMDQKVKAYLDAGAIEVWLVDLDGQVTYLCAEGPAPRSRFVSAVDLPARKKS